MGAATLCSATPFPGTALWHGDLWLRGFGDPTLEETDLQALAAYLQSLERGCTAAQAWELFDSLPAVRAEDVTGRWRGRELPTGHPMDGLLEVTGWYGKQFDDADHVHHQQPRDDQEHHRERECGIPPPPRGLADRVADVAAPGQQQLRELVAHADASDVLTADDHPQRRRQHRQQREHEAPGDAPLDAPHAGGELHLQGELALAAGEELVDLRRPLREHLHAAFA
mgnify:CR=1 FL=1